MDIGCGRGARQRRTTARRTSGETASGADGADACSGEAHADAQCPPGPTAAPAPSCGPPAIRPFAMPGPKIDNPSSARDARISVSASEMVGGSLKPEVK